MSLFEKAVRNKIRIQTSKGSLSVEDLWDLPLTSTRGQANLDELAVAFYNKTNEGASRSFVADVAVTKAAENDKLVFDILKHIIDVRLEENKKASEARAKSEQKAKILALLAEREDDSLKTKSTDELKALLQAY